MCNTIKNSILFATTCIILAYNTITLAGGPLVVEGPEGHTPVTYQNPNITLHIENGKLGDRSNIEADALMQQAIDLWNDVNTATIKLSKNEARLNFDINSNNFERYIPSIDETVFNANDGINPVVYDDTGEIIEAFFPGNASFIVGFSASIYYAAESYFSEGYTVINGGKTGLSDTEFKLLIAHEIGHFIGLDHSQTDINNKESFGFPQFCSTSNNSEYPVMYPFACRKENNLHVDDISAISALYPDQPEVDTQFGTLSGLLTDKFGNAISGANIWVKHNDGRAFSTVSDYLKQGTGFFKLLLPPGNYTLYANSINTEFTGGSSVGPYSLTSDGASFTCLGYLPDTRFEGSMPGNAEVITVALNQDSSVDFQLTSVEFDECDTLQKPSASNKSSSSKGGVATLPGLLLLLSVLLISRRFNRRV